MMQILHDFISINTTLIFLTSSVKIKPQPLTLPVYVVTSIVEVLFF